jgi:hypothetical protein
MTIRPVLRQPDAISDIVTKMKRRAGDHVGRLSWDEVDHELRASFAELHRSQYPVLTRAFKTAGVKRAPELLAQAWRCFNYASKLPKALEDFGSKTYGQPGLIALPVEAIRNLEAALGIIAEHLVRHEVKLSAIRSEIGETRGSKGSIVEKLDGAPVRRFLQRFIGLWVDATGQSQLGEQFNDCAKALLELSLRGSQATQHQEVGDLGRQIKRARRRPRIQTEWDHVTEIENMDLNRAGRPGTAAPARR